MTDVKLWVLYHHHHHVVPPARISLRLSRHFSLSFIASGRSSGLYPVSSQSWCMYVRAGRPAFARPYVGVHRSTSFMSSPLLLQQCPAYLVRLTWIVFVMGDRWPYSWFFVGCCLQDIWNHLTVCKKELRIVYQCQLQNVFTNIFKICVKGIWHLKTNRLVRFITY